MKAPWHCGSQFADWLSLNCERCVKYEPEGAPAACDLDAAIFGAVMGDGQIPDEIAERLGYDDTHGMPYVFDCAERVLSPAALESAAGGGTDTA